MRNNRTMEQEPPPQEFAGTYSAPPDPAVRAWKRLSESPYRELQRVTCNTRNGVLVLKGRVSSFYLKQLAQEIARQADGVQTIANQLEVHRQHA